MKLSNPKLFRQQCYINGTWRNAANGSSFAVLNPFDQSELGHVPSCGPVETEQAIQAAAAAWPEWQNKAPLERADILYRWYELMLENQEDLARIVTYELGRPINETRGTIAYAASFIRLGAEEATKIYGDLIAGNQAGDHITVTRKPVGVVAAITPWNFPSSMITRKVGPALAAGCTVVLKPGEDTPYSAFALAVLAEEAGLPKGVFNIVTGDAAPIGETLCASPIVRKLSFTGSTAVGSLLMRQCADTIKSLSLELGGNAPFIVFDDANIDQAIAGLMLSKFRNNGQTCICANRILVQNNIYDDFVVKLKATMQSMKLGDGFDEKTTQGPLVNAKALEKVSGLVDGAIKQGATCVTGGKASSNVGPLFYEPTLLTNIKLGMDIIDNEIFGPVAALIPFKTEQEAIHIANNTPFGLAAYFYSNNVKRCWRVGEALEYGMVGVNSGGFSSPYIPFGGVKQSGIGREGSKYALDEYLEMSSLYFAR